MLRWARRHVGIVREAVTYRRSLFGTYKARAEEDRSVAAEAEALGASEADVRKARRLVDGTVRIDTRFGPLHLRPADTDLLVIRQIFVDGEYDIDNLEQMARITARYREILAANETPIIVDGGANIGAASRWFALRFPEAAIVAIEPDPGNAAVARQNLAEVTNARVWEAALGSSEGKVALSTFDKQGWGARTERSEDGIAVITILQILESVPNGRLLIVKIDIEGFESDVFADNLGWIDDTAAIFLEPHDWMLPGGGSSQSFQKALLGSGRELLIAGENLIFVK